MGDRSSVMDFGATLVQQREQAKRVTWNGSPKHLEVMVSPCTAREFLEIREFFERRGYRLSEGRAGLVYRLYCDRR